MNHRLPTLEKSERVYVTSRDLLPQLISVNSQQKTHQQNNKMSANTMTQSAEEVRFNRSMPGRAAQEFNRLHPDYEAEQAASLAGISLAAAKRRLAQSSITARRQEADGTTTTVLPLIGRNWRHRRTPGYGSH